MHKLPGPFYNLRNRKVKTMDHDELMHVSTISVTATTSLSNPDAYTSSSSALRLSSKPLFMPPPPPPTSTSPPFPFSGTDIDYPPFSTLGQPYIDRAGSSSSQPVSATCHASPLQSTYVEPHVSALPVSHGHPSASHFQDDLAPNHNPFVSPRPPLSGNRSVGIETWAQNLTTPRLQSVPNQQASPPIPNITLPTFWETDVDLWFAAVDQIFASNGIWDEQRKFSVALNSLDLKSIRKVQHVVRNPGMFPYTNLKTTLAKTYRLCENDRLDKLFHNTELGDRKPSELLLEMRYLLDAFNTSDSQSQAVLRKLFLDKLPVQVRTILAGSFDTNLDFIALRADEIMAASKSSNTTNNPQRLINEIFDQRLNQLAATLHNSPQPQFASPQPPRHPWYNTAAGHSRGQNSRSHKFGGPGNRPTFHRQPNTKNSWHHPSRYSAAESDLCFYHRKFGVRANRCQSPCAWRSRSLPKNDSARHCGSAVSSRQ